MVIVRIDDVLNLFSDYLPSGDIPPDSKVVKMMYKPSDQNKLALVITGPNIKANASPLDVRFNVKQIFGVS